MHPDPRRVLPIVLLLVIFAAGFWWWQSRASAANSAGLQASGTLEATEFVITAEQPARVLQVLVQEGERVEAGQPLIELDHTLLDAQRVQLEAAARAAASAAEAAAANRDLLLAGASEPQLLAAQAGLDRALLARDVAQQAYDALPEAARSGAQGQQLKTQLELAEATVDSAQAQLELLQAGARAEQITAASAQAEAAAAQAEAARAALDLIDTQIARMTLRAPVNATVLSRAAEPGELAITGATLLVLADLQNLYMTVYLPEDRYGQIDLGQTASLEVDSFAGRRFSATVERIAGQAEFTPRNVQTEAGRRATVFAIRLRVADPEGLLKPGMPADLTFDR